MARRASRAVVGAFVLGALALLIAGALALGAGVWLTGELRFVLNFREAVTGLVVGSPVEFRGVKVGEVGEIRALFDPQTNTFYFPVEITLRAERFERLGPGAKNMSNHDVTIALVERGLRARLETQSFITGQKRIALDFFPDKIPDHAGHPVAQHLVELPTVPSQTEDIANLLREIPFERLGKDLAQVVDGLKRLVGPGSDGEVRPLSDVLASVQSELKPLLQEGRATLGSLRAAVEQGRTAMTAAEVSLKSVGAAAASVEQTSVETRTTLIEARAALKQVGTGLEQARSAIANLESLTGDDSAIVHDVTSAARDLGSAGRAVRALAEELRARPDALLRGRTSESAR